MLRYRMLPYPTGMLPYRMLRYRYRVLRHTYRMLPYGMLRYRYRYPSGMLPTGMLRYRYRYHLLAAAQGTRPKAGSSILNADRYYRCE